MLNKMNIQEKLIQNYPLINKVDTDGHIKELVSEKIKQLLDLIQLTQSSLDYMKIQQKKN